MSTVIQGCSHWVHLFVCMWRLKNVISKAIKARYINWTWNGVFTNFAWSGVRHLPTLGPPTSLWPARGFLSNITSKHGRFYFKHKQIGRLAHLSKTWKIVEVFKGLFSQFYAFIFSFLIKPELTYSCGKIGSFGHESMYFFCYWIGFLLIWNSSWIKFSVDDSNSTVIRIYYYLKNFFHII